jgi:hypothetical protein
LVQRYNKGEIPGNRQQSEAKVSVSLPDVAAERAVVTAKAGESVGTTNETAAKTQAVATKKQPGWFSALVTLSRASEKPDKEEPLSSRLVGDFDGWNGRSIFKLENGTRWIQQNKTESYDYAPTLHSPNVKITPAALGGFWMEIDGVNRNVRVIPFDLTGQ